VRGMPPSAAGALAQDAGEFLSDLNRPKVDRAVLGFLRSEALLGFDRLARGLMSKMADSSEEAPGIVERNGGSEKVDDEMKRATDDLARLAQDPPETV
jgi:hypothetical protein